MGAEANQDNNGLEEMAEKVEIETRKANKYLTMGWQVLGPVVGGVAIGWYIDSKSPQMFPLWTLLFGAVSIIVSLWQLIKNTK